MGCTWDVEDWQDHISGWQDDTFPDATEESVIAHLKDEVENEIVPGCEPEELADCIFLLIGIANKRGIRLVDAMRKKFDINRDRSWETEKNSKGFFSHLDEKPE